jgi:predicted transcriptional regulator
MDWVCKELTKILDKGTALSLSSIVEKSGFARQTVFNHLKHLLEAGIITKNSVRIKRGRPTVLYRKKTTEFKVSLTFKRLGDNCMHHKDGWCKVARQKCIQEKCFLIR